MTLLAREPLDIKTGRKMWKTFMSQETMTDADSQASSMILFPFFTVLIIYFLIANYF
jgi:hypothetical protein